MKLKSILILLFISFSLQILAQEKLIGDIKLQGVKNLNKNFLLNFLETKKGNVLDSTQIKKDIVLLKRLPAVAHVFYQVFHSHDNYYNVFINIEENFTLIPVVNFWTTTNKRFAYKLGVYEYNLLGKNIALGGFYQNNGFNSYGLNLKAPNLFSKKWGLALNYQDWKSEEPLYFGDKTANYLYNNVSFEALGLYQVNLKNELNFGVNFFNEEYKYLTGATAPSIPQHLNLDKILLKFIYSYNDLKYHYQYINGFKSVLYTQYVTSNNSFQKDFFIAWNDFFYYKRLGDKGNWANRLRIGLSSNEKTPFAPFALDNNVNLRGVGILVDRGTGSIVWNTEYRHTVLERKWLTVQTNIFSDFGSWRNPGGELNDFIKSENLRVYSGFGLRFISKKIYNATFRIDYGVRLSHNPGKSKGGLVFGLGQYF